MSYGTWNERLVAHVLGRAGGQEPVSRIPATPEELCIVAGKDPAALSASEISALVIDFVESIKVELATERKTYFTYCHYYRKDPSWWSPRSYELPYFFGMLWMSCLVAYGYPEIEGGFYNRLKALFGAGQNLRASDVNLEDVWEDLERWTNERSEYRRLALPPRCAHRTVIGRSHFLAFPHRFDRERLTSILADAGLTGHEPPVRTVLEVLLRERQQFSSEFQDDLDQLMRLYLGKGRDPKESPFWRAVRQAARDAPAGNGRLDSGTGDVGILAEWDADDLLTPFLAYPDNWSSPPSWEWQRLELNVGTLTRRALLDASTVASILAAPADTLQPSSRRAAIEGFVPLLEEASGLYRVAVADEIAACELALVRTDLAPALQAAFGGRLEEAGLPAWALLTKARLQQRDSLPPNLSGLRSLLQTTDAPKPVLVGGVRAGGVTFYAIASYLPSVHARGATSVAVHSGDASWPCEPEATPDYWRLPAAVADRCLETGTLSSYVIRAKYEDEVLGKIVTREAHATLHLQVPVLATNYKGVPSGSFRLETCSFDGAAVTGPLPSLPSDFASGERDAVLDMLPFDRTARWLGPGHGEMSLQPQNDFPWLVVGPKNHPTFVVLLADDLLSVPAPSDAYSPSKGDKRHWGSAFGPTAPTWLKRRNEYLEEGRWPDEARPILASYRARRTARERDLVAAPEVRLDSHISDARWGFAGDTSHSLHDLLAALFQNQAGCSLREVHEHVGRVFELEKAHHLREHIIRSLVDSGALSLLRRRDSRQSIVVANRPTLVGYRFGPHWVGVMSGLVSAAVRHEFREAAARTPNSFLEERRSANPYTSGTLSLRVSNAAALDQFAGQLGFAPPTYIQWPNSAELPGAFRITGTLRSDPVPDMYEVEARWCWHAGGFRRYPVQQGNVTIERRRDQGRVPIYVVSREGNVLGWSYFRTWALLAAHEASEDPFLTAESLGVFAVHGESPLHLPTPLGRLCALVGIGLPGPRLSRADPKRVEAYCYPFGPHLSRLLLPLLPDKWFATRNT